MIPYVVASFAQPSVAHAAADRLAGDGFARDDILVHDGASSSTHAAAIGIDEAVTGGIVGSFAKLLHGLLLAKPDADALTYQDAVGKEGTIVSVTVRSDDETARAIESLEDSGAVRVARLPQEGLDD